MSKIVLIRPGSTDFDRQGRIQGTLDVPLSDEGRQEMIEAVEPLRQQGITILYASPCEAAEQSGQVIADALGVKLKVIDKLQNVDHGLWQGMLIDDVKTKQPKVYRQWQEQPENICPPEGEMLSTARERVEQVISKLARKHKDDVVGLIVPEPLASVVCSITRDESLGDLWKATACGTWETIANTPDVSGASS